MLKQIKESLKDNKDWKEKNKKYLRELQSFFDKADNIEDEKLRNKIIGQICGKEKDKDYNGQKYIKPKQLRTF